MTDNAPSEPSHDRRSKALRGCGDLPTGDEPVLPNAAVDDLARWFGELDRLNDSPFMESGRRQPMAPVPGVQSLA